MKEWGGLDWAGFLAFWAGAIVLAIDAGFKQSSPGIKEWASPMLEAKLWGFIPLICLSVATIIFVGKTFDFLGKTTNQSSPEQVTFIKFPDPYRPIVVIGKTFRNEKVILDGYSYTNCIFENVTFVFNGTTPITMVNNKIGGLITLKSDNPSVDAAWLVSEMFRDAPGQRKVEVSPNSVFEPVKRPE